MYGSSRSVCNMCSREQLPNLAAWDYERVKAAGSSATLTRFLVGWSFCPPFAPLRLVTGKMREKNKGPGGVQDPPAGVAPRRRRRVDL